MSRGAAAQATGGRRWPEAQAARIATTAMALPATATAHAPPPSRARPPSKDPVAIPALPAPPRRDAARGGPPPPRAPPYFGSLPPPPLPPGALRPSQQRALASLHGRQTPSTMPAPGQIRLRRLPRPLAGILPHRLQQPVSRLLPSSFTKNQ